MIGSKNNMRKNINEILVYPREFFFRLPGMAVPGIRRLPGIQKTSQTGEYNKWINMI